MGDIQPSRFPKTFNHREVDILCLIKQGLTNQEISHKLFLSLDTVKMKQFLEVHFLLRS
jgi:ATP/maltotriose-dependent transcriptional regulator MalT